ncbi:MAG: hypothetical protein WDW38_005543 [Sanguina aurantia]
MDGLIQHLVSAQDHCNTVVQGGLSRATEWFQQTPLGQAQRHASTAGRDLQGMWHPMLASISLSHSSPVRRVGAQPLLDLAMAKDEVKARLSPVPVYTVANPKNEFVLIAGDNNSQLGFFFFRKEDAEAIVEKIREQNPRLARDSKILRVTMDNVFEVFTTPREETGLQQYVPLFLCKEDLDVAVQSAYRQRNAAQIKLYSDKAEKLEDDFAQISQQLVVASGRDKSGLETKAAKARQKMEVAREKSDSVEKAPLPKIEVGSFEEVIQRMTMSEGPDLAAWAQVMFVAPGLLQQPTMTIQDSSNTSSAVIKNGKVITPAVVPSGKQLAVVTGSGPEKK